MTSSAEAEEADERAAPEDAAREEGVALPPREDLVCVRCHAQPEALLWSQAQGQLVHGATKGAPAAGRVRRVCGGLVVARGMEWMHALAPGVVVLCHPADRSLVAHHVRLGHPARDGPGSWRGTPLCGRPRLTAARWAPVLPAVAARMDVCPACRRAHALGGAA